MLNQRNGTDPYADTAADPWQQVECAAHVIDTAALSPRNRIRRDDQGRVPDNGRPEPLLTIVIQTLVCLRDGFAVEHAGECGADRALRHLLQALVAALERVEREQRGHRKRK